MKPPVVSNEWPEDVRALYEHDAREIWNPNIARHIWNQYHNQLDIYLGLVGAEPLRILDVGCAQGTLALLLAERGHSVHAMDIRPQFLDYARSRYERGDIEFIVANAMEWMPSGRYDLIFANQIVEHLVRPEEFAGRLTSWLEPGGRLVMTTPNWHYVKNPLPSFTELGDHRQYLGREFTADADGHFFAYTAAELASIFERSGLTNVEARLFETPWISGHMKMRYLHGRVPAALLSLLDRATLGLPVIAQRLAHQLMISGVRVQP